MTLAAVLLFALMVVSACSPDKPDTLDWPVQDFSFTDQNGQTVSLDSLKGQVWLADFIFTNCTTVCQPMTFNMSKVQEMLKEEGVDAKLISFSIDPERDTPEVLKEFVSGYTQDQSNWHLLTGYAQEDISKFADESFNTIAMPAEDSDQFIHQTLFYLVDQNGTVVEAYNGTELDFDKVVKDTKALAS